MNETPAVPLTESQYYQVDKLKFSLLSLCTFNIYQLFWSYKNWRFIKERDGSDIWPFWRGWFAVFWYYSLLNDISEHSNSKVSFSENSKWSLAASFFLLGYAANLPDPYWIIYFLLFVPVLPAVSAIEKLNNSQMIREHRKSHSIGNFVIYLVGGPLLVLILLSSFNYIPSSAVVDGSSLSKSNLAFLAEEDLIYDDEQILYFYSSGILSIKDDGQFISDGYIVSYYRDPEDSKLYGEKVAYEDVEDVSIKWSSSFLDNTIVNITDVDQGNFEIWLSSEGERDKIFVNELMRRWRNAR